MAIDPLQGLNKLQAKMAVPVDTIARLKERLD